MVSSRMRPRVPPLVGSWFGRPRSSRSRRSRYRPFNPIVLLVIIVLLIFFRGILQKGSHHLNDDATLSEGIYLVERVIDGDTLKLANGETVRLIGIDTPETVKPAAAVERFGREATAFTTTFLQDHSFQVRLSFDSVRRDKYGRLLAYVWGGDRLLNEELVRAGLAHVETEYSYSRAMKDRLLIAESEAKKNRRGIWSLPDSLP